MIGTSFVAAVGIVAFATAWITSAASLLVMPAARRLEPTARADLAICVSAAPALLTAVLVMGVAAPALGVGSDHCSAHVHHAHLCPWHGSPLTPSWLLLGAAAWGWFAVRLVGAAQRVVRAESIARRLLRLGPRPTDGVQVVTTSVLLCHAIGIVRPRVVVSQGLADALPAAQLLAAISHERGHVARADPAWSAALEIVGSVTPFGRGWAGVWRRAAEEAADDVAASQSDGLTVARALVSVARLRVAAAPGLAFGDGPGLEHRVRRLLDGPAAPGLSRARGYMAILLVGAVLFGASWRGALHHGVEEAWAGLVDTGN